MPPSKPILGTALAFILVATPAAAQKTCPEPDTPDPLERSDTSLVVHLASERVELPVVAEGTTFEYEYLGYLERIQHHLLRATFWLGEGSEVLLISHCTGSRILLAGEPVVSPDAQRFAVASADLDAGYSPTVLQVWRRTEAGFELEWEVRPLDELEEGESPWGPTDVEWFGERALRFTIIGSLLQPISTGVARLQGDSWVISREPS